MKIVLDQNIWISSNASSRLKSLRPVFRKLRTVHRLYIVGEVECHAWGDCPYWYSERPHIGLLAAAVWLCGGTALEEYGSQKSKKRKTSKGRCDLYFKTREVGFECEAKRLWLNLGSDVARNVLKIRRSLDWAAKDVKELQGKRRLALSFVSPAIHESRVDGWDERLRGLVKSLKKELQCDAIIWIGVPKEETPPGAGKHKYPGLLLIIRELKGAHLR